ncbi:hypothetical protein DL770_004029 [Monosporascus sp. CRB-9-2]|nr:hypothetical protein DL770_004029 [Monosporascus sp. CRB-9-2]
MCVTVHLHHTSYAHESRFLSVINVATGYTVFSPFQEPFYRSCPRPCSRPYDEVPPRNRCRWHRGCCWLETTSLRCREYLAASERNQLPGRRTTQQQKQQIRRGECPRPVTCLHLYEGEDRRLPEGYLDYLLACDPLFLCLQNLLFGTGAELVLACAHRRVAALRRLELFLAGFAVDTPPPPTYADADADEALGRDAARAEGVAGLAAAFLVELARFWDGEKRLPPRPGREEGDPALNLARWETYFLRTCAYFEHADFLRAEAPPPMPRRGFERTVREFGHDTHVVPWAALLPVVDFNTVLPT